MICMSPTGYNGSVMTAGFFALTLVSLMVSATVIPEKQQQRNVAVLVGGRSGIQLNSRSVVRIKFEPRRWVIGTLIRELPYKAPLRRAAVCMEAP